MAASNFFPKNHLKINPKKTNLAPLRYKNFIKQKQHHTSLFIHSKQGSENLNFFGEIEKKLNKKRKEKYIRISVV